MVFLLSSLNEGSINEGSNTIYANMYTRTDPMYGYIQTLCMDTYRPYVWIHTDPMYGYIQTLCMDTYTHNNINK
jgi:hypothetical protein